MKWFLISLVLLTSVMFALMMTAKHNLPQISLPKFAQHNTIGELPIVEMADDGAFAEVDGAETEQASYWCDELKRGFTCQVKFGMSYGVARRIAEEELLSSCEEARAVENESLEFCIENAYPIKDMMDNYNLTEQEATKIYYADVDRCWGSHKYIPECHGTYKDWLYDYHTGGLK